MKASTAAAHADTARARPADVNRLWRTVSWIGALFVVAMIVLAADDIVRSRHAALDEAARDVQRRSRVLAEQTARSLQAVDRALRHVVEDSRSGALRWSSPQDLHLYLREHAQGLVVAEGLALIDAQGHIVASSFVSDPVRRNLAAEPDFVRVRESRGPGPLLGTARAGIVLSQQWFMPLARRLEAADGSFAGAAAASVRVEYFQSFYRDIHPEPGTTIALVHLNGTLSARQPAAPALLGRPYEALGPQAPPWPADQPTAVARMLSPVDGREELGARSLVAGFPVAVIVTRDIATVLAPWRARAQGTALRNAAGVAMALVLMFLLRWQLQSLARTRTSLELSRERFALAAAGSDEGIWDWDLAGDEVYASPRARTIFGLGPGPETQPRREWFAAVHVHPEDQPHRAHVLAEHLRGRIAAYAHEYRVQHPKGTREGSDERLWRWVRVRGVCERNAAGRALRMAGSVTDIDAHRRGQDALRQSEQRYALAMAGLTGGHWVWEVESGQIFVSESLRELIGLPPETPVESTASYLARKALHPSDAAAFFRMVDQLKSGAARRGDLEYRVFVRDHAEPRWILTRAQAFAGPDGAVQRVAGVSVDITERKRTEWALKASEKRFALAVAGSNDGILDWDIEHDSMYSSERAMRLLGIESTVTTRTRAEWVALVDIHPEDRARHDADLQAALEGRTEMRDGEYRVRTAERQYRWLRVRMICVRDDGGRATRMTGSVTDIDDYKRAEAALRISEERYSFAMTGSNEGHWVWDFGSGQVFISARMAQIFALGEQALELPAESYFSGLPLHPEDRERVRANREAHVAGLTPRLDHEFRIVVPGAAGDEVRWIHTRAQCFRDAQGQPLRLAGATVDITARKHTEAALKESEQRYALAVGGADVGLWDIDYKRRIIFGSRRSRELLGLPLEPEIEDLDTSYHAVPIHPDEAPQRELAMQQHLAGQTPAYEGEWRVRQHDGVYRWVRVRGVCMRDADGKPLRMAGSVTDIDARKRAEQALRQSEERYALAVAGSDDGVWDWDFEAGQAFESRRARELQGLAPGPEVQPLAELVDALRVHPEDAPRRAEALRAHLAGETPAYECDYRVRHDDAQGVSFYRWIHVRALCIRDAGGRPCRIAGSVTDIDARKRAEEALRASEEALKRSDERYQLAVAGSDQGIWDWDLRTDTTFLSPRLQQILLAKVGALQAGRRDWLAQIAVHPDDIATVREAVSQHLRGHTRSLRVECRVRQPSGEWRWYRQRGVAVRDAEGRATRMAGSMEDITDRKEAEAARDRLEAQLRQAQKLEAIGTLAGGIAHDFNNILAAILGYGEMALKDAREGSSQRRHIDAALSAGHRAKSLVERILAFSRSGVGERVPVHVQSVVAEALDEMRATTPEGITIERRLEAGDAAVLGDPTQVHQVVANLCANAVQAMKGQGTLAVSLDVMAMDAGCHSCHSCHLPPGDYVRLSVKDTGPGITPALRERIFDPFFTTKEVGVGTGLGLSMVHGIVTDLGGGIDVDSEPGAGATFSIFLPRSAAAAASPPAAHDADALPAPSGAGQTVLVVDDEESLVRLGEELIAELGYEPVGFTSSRAALAAFSADPARFDLVLSDEAMPEMTGSELARAIRAVRGDIPIVLMSGYVTPALNQRAREAGVAEVLAKPLAAREMARSLAGALGQR